MELVNVCFKDAWKTCCCLCFNHAEHLKLEVHNFSNNIYKEIGAEELKQEYKKSKTEFGDVRSMVQSNVLDQDE